jgi:hypothetical protein
MKYNKSQRGLSFKPFIIIGVLIIIFSLVFKDVIYRSLVTINLGGFYVSYLNTRADFINALNDNEVDILEVSMSPNNFVKLQKDRSLMLSNYVINGSQWTFDNQYFKSKVLINERKSKAEIRLFGMNPDHYRSPKGFSFRLKFNGGEGFGNKKVNLMNPRSRDFNSDVLSNIIFYELSDGIKINYDLFKVIFNKSNYGYYLKEDFFDKYLIEENNRRESVIFEVLKDSIHFNHIGDDEEFISLSQEIEDLNVNNYEKFLDFFDMEKIKSILLISLIINDKHPLLDINLHWVHNPVTGLFEPTFREGFVYSLSEFELNKLSYQGLINDLYEKFIKDDFNDFVATSLPLVKNIILNNKDYKDFKNKMSGFKDQIETRENIILENITIIEKSLNNYPNKLKNHEQKIININKDTIISDNWKIKSNEKLIIHDGVNITLKGVYLRILGGLEILGKKNSKVHIISPNGESSTIYVQSKTPIRIAHTIFQKLSNNKSSYSQPAAITFYETPEIKISDSEFNSNTSGDDFLNFFRCDKVDISNSVFKNTYSDALDSDFSNIVVTSSIFEKIGNDAIDGSGSEILINKSIFLYCKDKAVSAGEKSIVEISNCRLDNNEIAIVSKDQSIVVSKNNDLNNNRLDLAVFKKKKFYSRPTIINHNTFFKNYLIEKKSNIEGFENIIFSSNVEDKLYGNLYGRSTEK